MSQALKRRVMKLEGNKLTGRPVEEVLSTACLEGWAETLDSLPESVILGERDFCYNGADVNRRYGPVSPARMAEVKKECQEVARQIRDGKLVTALAIAGASPSEVLRGQLHEAGDDL